MSDLFSKIENFLFDILGLVLPGLIFLTVLISPIVLLDQQVYSSVNINSSLMLSGLAMINKFLKYYWNTSSSITILFLIIISYIIGHAVKVFAIILYEILSEIFDNLICKNISSLQNILVSKTYNFYLKHFKETILDKKVYNFLMIFYAIFKNIVIKIFYFKSPNFFSENETLKNNCIKLINSKLGTNYPEAWYSVYKFSTVIINQEAIKSLAGNFLAKYNLYRSLAFIFIFGSIYYFIFFNSTKMTLAPEISNLSSTIILLLILLWFTFHYKYKRYWTLCGNETLVSLFYFLNKSKINEK